MSPSALRQAWAKAVDYINNNPEEARKYLAKNTLTPPDLVDSVPMLGYIMTKNMIARAARLSAGNSPISAPKIGVVPEKVDVKKYLKSF